MADPQNDNSQQQDRIIDLPGVGPTTFPGSMSEEDFQGAVKAAVMDHQLRTGQGMEQQAQTQAKDVETQAGRHMKGMFSGMGTPPASIATDENSAINWNAATRPKLSLSMTGTAPQTEVPPGMENAGNLAKGLNKNAGVLATAAAAPEVGIPKLAGGLLGGSALGNAAGWASDELGFSPEAKETAETVGTASGGFYGAKGFGGIESLGDKTPKSLFPSDEKAMNLFRRGIAPNTMKANDADAFANTFKTASPAIGQYTKAAPITSGEGGAIRVGNVSRQAAQNIYDEQVLPVVDNYGHVMRPTNDVNAAIKGSLAKQQTAPENVVQAGNDFADKFFNGPMSVKQMNDLVTELNNDKSVSKYYDMDPQQKSQIEIADPRIRGKVAAVDALRAKLFQTVGEEGGETQNAQFQQARKQYGSLMEMEDMARNARVPTPQPLYKQAGRSLRGLVSRSGPEMYGSTGGMLSFLDNPNRLLPKAFNTLGQTSIPDSTGAMGTVGRMSQLTLPGKMLPEPPAALPAIPDTSGTVPSNPPPIEPTTRAQRLGLILPKATDVTPQYGYTPTRAEGGVPVQEGKGSFNAPTTPGTAGKQYSSSIGPQEAGNKMGQTAKVGNELWSWNGERWQRSNTGGEGRTLNPEPQQTPKPQVNPPMARVMSPFKTPISGPPLERTVQMAQADRIMRDPLATARDKAIAKSTLDSLREDALKERQ